MSKTEKIYNKTVKAVQQWLDAVDNYTPEEFKKTIGENEWTIGQVYMHVLLSANAFFIPQIENCLAGKHLVQGDKKFVHKLIFLWGSFPPMKVKVPKSLDKFPVPQPRQEDVKEGLKMLLKTLEDVKNRIEKNFNPANKTKHPVFGPINAQEWLLNIEMHTRHHLRQKQKIDRALGK